MSLMLTLFNLTTTVPYLTFLFLGQLETKFKIKLKELNQKVFTHVGLL